MFNHCFEKYNPLSVSNLLISKTNKLNSQGYIPQNITTRLTSFKAQFKSQLTKQDKSEVNCLVLRYLFSFKLSAENEIGVT